MAVRFKPRPSKRDVRNTLATYDTLANGAEVVLEAAKPRGPQAEGETNKAIAQWAPLPPDLFIARNKRRLATPPGYARPIMLGWDVPGSADWIGWRRVVVTADMVGKPIAQFVAIEAKRPSGGVVSDEQERFLNRLKDDGGIAGVARSAEDAEAILTNWRRGA